MRGPVARQETRVSSTSRAELVLDHEAVEIEVDDALPRRQAEASATAPSQV
jgi:hypothetical protein